MTLNLIPKPVFVEEPTFKHAFGLGFSFYRWGRDDEHRSLTIYFRRKDYTWEWTR